MIFTHGHRLPNMPSYLATGMQRRIRRLPRGP
jgi:hypothetical protein